MREVLIFAAGALSMIAVAGVVFWLLELQERRSDRTWGL